MARNTTLGRSRFFKEVIGNNGNGNVDELNEFANYVSDTSKPLTVQSREYLNSQFGIPYSHYNVMWADYYNNTSTFLQDFSTSSAAYSLRALTPYGTDVVRVRRTSDDAEQDFTANEVKNGTLQNWVNGVNTTLPLDRDSDAAVAYSLRALKSGFDGAVVRVRRSSDDAEQDFTATEVSDGSLEDWVNEDVDIYESDFTATEDGFLRNVPSDDAEVERINGPIAGV